MAMLNVWSHADSEGSTTCAQAHTLTRTLPVLWSLLFLDTHLTHRAHFSTLTVQGRIEESVHQVIIRRLALLECNGYHFHIHDLTLLCSCLSLTVLLCVNSTMSVSTTIHHSNTQRESGRRSRGCPWVTLDKGIRNDLRYGAGWWCRRPMQSTIAAGDISAVFAGTPLLERLLFFCSLVMSEEVEQTYV